MVGKIANKPPTIQSIFANPGINPYQNITSIGLIYNQQFDTFTELLQKISGKYRREQKKKEAEKEKQRLDKEAILRENKKGHRK